MVAPLKRTITQFARICHQMFRDPSWLARVQIQQSPALTVNNVPVHATSFLKKLFPLYSLTTDSGVSVARHPDLPHVNHTVVVARVFRQYVKVEHILL